jgi:hypothetical protein
LSTVVHEMGHALHFLLSSSAAGAGVEDCGCWAHPELKEVAAHLTERMTRDPRCLQVRGGWVGVPGVRWAAGNCAWRPLSPCLLLLRLGLPAATAIHQQLAVVCTFILLDVL